MESKRERMLEMIDLKFGLTKAFTETSRKLERMGRAAVENFMVTGTMDRL